MPTTVDLKQTRIDSIDRREPRPVAPSTPIAEVYRIFDEEGLGGVAVVDADDLVIGIFTERDILYRTALEKIDPETPIAEFMTRAPETLAVDAQVAEAVGVMQRGGHRHVPLVDSTGLHAGILTSRDILRHIASHFPEAVLNLPPHLHQRFRRPEGG